MLSLLLFHSYHVFHLALHHFLLSHKHGQASHEIKAWIISRFTGSANCSWHWALRITLSQHKTVWQMWSQFRVTVTYYIKRFVLLFSVVFGVNWMERMQASPPAPPVKSLVIDWLSQLLCLPTMQKAKKTNKQTKRSCLRNVCLCGGPSTAQIHSTI